jgi:hypothetical protein
MEDWQSDETANVESGACTSWCTAYLWIIPAKVEGKWQLPDGELTIKQQFQMIAGTLASGGKETAIQGKLNGDGISFAAGSSQYDGRVEGDVISGTIKSGAAWRATRVKQ